MIVVKVGGSIAERCQALLDEVADRDDVVLVHGFGPQTDEACQERGIEPRQLRSPGGVTSRFTDEAVLDAMRAAATSVQSVLLDDLAERGLDPVGLGHDPPLIWAEVKPALRHERDDGRVVLVRGNRSGRVACLEASPVARSLEEGRTPVVTPLAIDGQGPVSVDADRAAAALAGALDACALVLLTDVHGVLDEGAGSATRVERVAVDEIDALVGQTVTGGMVRKLVACREAIESGVERAVIGQGLRERPVERALGGDATEVTA